MKLIAKIIAIILLILSTLVSGFALLCALGIVKESQFNLLSKTVFSSLGSEGAVVVTAAIFIALILVLVMIIWPRRSPRRASHVLTAYDGSIKISHTAIAELIRSLAKRDASIVRVRVKTRETNDGLYVLTVLTLKRESDIKAVSQKVKKETEEFLVEQCGVKLSEVEVLLDRVIGRI